MRYPITTKKKNYIKYTETFAGIKAEGDKKIGIIDIMRRRKSLKKHQCLLLVDFFFFVTDSVPVQVENFISLKNYNLKLQGCSKFPIIESSL